MVDFAKMLKTPVADIKPAPTLPVGTYQCRVGSYKTVAKEIQGEEKGIFTFGLQILAPLGDVDEEAIETFGGLDQLKKYKLNHDVFVGDNDNLSNIVRFATETCKVEQTEGMQFDELLAETKGVTVVVAIQHKPRKKGEGVVAVISSVLADEE